MKKLVIDLGVVTEKRGFYTLRHILPKYQYIQRNFWIYWYFNYSETYFKHIP